MKTVDNVIDLRDRRPLVDINAVAAYLGVTVRHVRRLVDERRIPFIKWGHLLRFDLDEIDSWLEACRFPPLRPA